MFFILSKVLLFLVQPLNWVFGILVYALWTKIPVRRKKALWSALLLMFLLNNHFLFNLVVNWWEPETIRADQIRQPYDVGILLGGYSNFFIEPSSDRHNFNERGARLFQTIDLYKQGKIKKILLTGGSGRLLTREHSEATMIVPFLERLGIPKEDLIVEPNSRNTRENALFSKAILDSIPGAQSCLLITSAWHLPRGQGCFRKVGLDCTPYAVDYLSERYRLAAESILVPDRLGFYHWDILAREWVGYIMYKINGYI